MAAAWARILGQTLRDALAFDRPGRFPLRDPFSGEISGWGGARAPLPAVDPALAAAFPGRSPRELLGALERGRGTLYDALRAYAATAPRPAAGQVLRRAPAGPGSRLGAAGLWDCRRTRPTFYACLADGERLQQSPWGRLQVNPRQQAFRPIFRALLAQGTPAPAAMREAWRQVRANPGARWHGRMATAAEVDRGQAEQRGLVIGSHYYRGKREANRESQEASRYMGLNPGPEWHDRQAVFAERIAGQEPRRRQYWEGQGDAHTYSALAARQGENPQESFDPFDYDSPAAAKRARDARYRELRARGIPARRSVLHGQLEKYRGLGVGGRGVRDIYYLTWADPAPPGAAVEVPWPQENPWAAWHEARVSQYRRLARAARPGSRRRGELLAMARAHQESARASGALGVEPPRIPGGRRNPTRRFQVETLEPKGRFDPRSFRTVVTDGARVTVGCPRGKWDPRRERCKVGTRAQRILHPRGNPLTPAEVERLRGWQADEWAAADRWRAQGKGTRAEWHSGIGTGLGYAATLLPKANPPAARYASRIPAGAVEIYGRLNRIFATKGRDSRYPGQRFVHRFTKPARILGLPDGRLLITPVGRR